ncbi:MAG: hypothetical protein HYY04_05575 [Chloroflexi bacterium]|nr:hypothetical protein [Chloroflexota bacterium]
MDPAYITSATWQTIFAAAASGFRFAGLVILAALTFLVAHALIPSLVFTHHLSVHAHATRRYLYAVALVISVLAITQLAQFIGSAIIAIREIYPRWTI